MSGDTLALHALARQTGWLRLALVAPQQAPSEHHTYPSRHLALKPLAAALPCPSRSAPAVANVAAKTAFTATEVVVTPPSLAPAGGWLKYSLSICPTSPAGACVTKDCSSPPKPSPATSTCALADLIPGTQYAVKATAVAGSILSLESTAAAFATPLE